MKSNTKIKPESNSNTSYANPWLRLLSGLVSFSVCIALLSYIVSPIFKATEISEIVSFILKAIVYGSLYMLVMPIINVFSLNKLGGTVADLITGLRVTDKSKGNISIPKALFRTYIGSQTNWIFAGIGALWVFADEKRRTWADMVSETVVVKRTNSWLISVFILATCLTMASVKISESVNSAIANKDNYMQIVDELKYEFAIEDGSDPELDPLLPPEYLYEEDIDSV